MAKIIVNEQKIKNLLERGVEEIIEKESLEEKLKSGRKLRIKYGVDVTAPLLHLGHAVNLWKMRELQEMGHKVLFLIGDATSLIGDPTGKSQTRPMLTKKQIEKDAKEYISQISKILLTSSKVFEVRKNSEWYKKMKVEEFFGLASKMTHAQLIERDMFQERIKNQREIYEHEILYPILQGYDSVMLKSDLTVIGADQLFNELLGRKYQEIFSQKPQDIMTTVITPGIDGKEKQSKSLGNYIAIIDSPREKFGKIMSIPDYLIIDYLKVYTEVFFDEIDNFENRLKNQSINPRDAKLFLAEKIVERYHGEKAAGKAKEEFISVFSKKEAPKEAETLDLPRKNIVDALAESGAVKSKMEARRLISAGGVKIDGKKISDLNYLIAKNDEDKILQIGKKRFFRIIIK